MQLDRYSKGDYSTGASPIRQILWYFIGLPLLRSSLIPFSHFRTILLRLFGAKIGSGVRIKPGVRVKFPWRLTIGDWSWIGEDVWIDNLAEVVIGSHSCISQGVYLCTGNHDWSREDFLLSPKPITIQSHVWLGAQSRVGPGVTIHEGAVLLLASVISNDIKEWSVYSGNPAEFKKPRKYPGRNS